jgi:hypothetical protein
MAVRTNVAEAAGTIEAVAVAAAPGAQQHTLAYRLTAVGTSQKFGEDFVVPPDKSLTPHLAPVRFLAVARFCRKGFSDAPGCCLKQSSKHFFGVGKTFYGVNR